MQSILKDLFDIKNFNLNLKKKNQIANLQEKKKHIVRRMIVGIALRRKISLSYFVTPTLSLMAGMQRAPRSFSLANASL